MTNAPEADVADLRAVGRDHLTHVIARVLVQQGSSPGGGPSFTAAYDLARQVAEQIERLDWQVLRPHHQPTNRRPLAGSHADDAEHELG